jgi:signal transduction histidine kinase
MLVISVSLVLEWFAVWGWASLVSAESPISGAYLFGIWSFAFVPALLGAAGVVAFYPSGESLSWRLTVALIFSLAAGVLRFGVELAVWGSDFLFGPVSLEALLAVAVPFSCISVSMYLAKSQIRAVKAERLMAELEFEARQTALERENAELRVRREISAVLHDHVQQRLVFAASRLQSEVIPMAQVNDDQVAIDLLREIIADIDRLREDDVRALSHSLFPVGADMGLHQAVALAIGRVPASVSVTLNVSPAAAAFDTILEPALDVASRAVLVAVLDEAVTNALKHGSAKAVTVALDLSKDASAHDAAPRLVLTVANDGLALADGARPSGGLGRHQLSLEARGGGLSLRTGASGLTEVTAWLPVPSPDPPPTDPPPADPPPPATRPRA